MRAPESPKDKLPPGMRNMPVVVRLTGVDVEYDEKINKKWFKHFWDDLGAVAEYENYKIRQKTKYTNQYKLMLEKTKFVRG